MLSLCENEVVNLASVENLFKGIPPSPEDDTIVDGSLIWGREKRCEGEVKMMLHF